MLGKNWQTERSINFYFAIQLLFSARRYKFGSINNNELLIINLTAVRAGRMQILVLRHALNVSGKIKLQLWKTN
jgi:hypothetical protein